MLLNPRRTRTNMKLLQLVSFFLLTLSGQTATTMMQVKEDDDAILNCFLGTGNIKDEVFDWKKDEDKNKKEVFLYAKGSYYGHGQTGQDPHFVGRVFHFPDQLQFGNASIVIRKTKTSDSGTYTCHFPNHQPEIRSSISLTVGASPRPVVTVRKTKEGMLLKCEVLGSFPKPVVEWRDSDGNILAVGDPQASDGKRNKYDVILTYTVINSGDYRCVATQKDINHQIETETHVVVPGAPSEPSHHEEKPSGAVVGVGTLVAAVLVASVIIGAVLLIVGIVIGRRYKSNSGGSAVDGTNRGNGYTTTPTDG